jgi:hypothetical protein
MGNLYKLAFAFFVAALSLQGGGAALAQDSQLREVFLRDYPPALKVLESRFASAKGAVRVSREVSPGQTEGGGVKREWVGTIAFERKGPYMARAVGDIDQNITKADEKIALHRVKANCYNRDYSFQLRKRDANDQFFATSIEHNDGRKTPADDTSMVSLLYTYLEASHRIPVLSMSGLLADEQFSVRAVSRVDGGKTPWLKVEFETGANSKWFGALKGWFVVSPDEAWVLRSYDYARGGGKGMHQWGSVEYAGEQGGIPLPKRVSRHSRAPGGGREQSRTWDFDEISLVDVPDRDFTLAAFGFPEPAQSVARSAGSFAPMLFGIAGLSMAAAVAFKVASSRLHRKGSPGGA